MDDDQFTVCASPDIEFETICAFLDRTPKTGHGIFGMARKAGTAAVSEDLHEF
jgi:hypothetical protein